MFRPREGGARIGLLLRSNAFCNNRLKRPIIAVNTRWKPERDAKAVAGALRCCCKRACSKRLE
jgi:hypothetical protein